MIDNAIRDQLIAENPTDTKIDDWLYTPGIEDIASIVDDKICKKMPYIKKYDCFFMAKLISIHLNIYKDKCNSLGRDSDTKKTEKVKVENAKDTLVKYLEKVGNRDLAEQISNIQHTWITKKASIKKEFYITLKFLIENILLDIIPNVDPHSLAPRGIYKDKKNIQQTAKDLAESIKL
jgi:hypothetical protein